MFELGRWEEEPGEGERGLNEVVAGQVDEKG